MTRPVLGVLGGMGPAATADFLMKLAEVTPAARDQDHLQTILYSDPSTPDRSAAILDDGPSPLEAMRAGLKFLECSGASLIAIPCNTAHYWYRELAESTTVPILHIVQAVADQLRREAPQVRTLGLLSTDGTARSRIYHDVLAGSGAKVIDLSDAGTQNQTMAGIRAVKAGNLVQARQLLTSAIETLRTLGADGMIYGCTDVSAVLELPPRGVQVPAWDSATALALACVERLMD